MEKQLTDTSMDSLKNALDVITNNVTLNQSPNGNQSNSKIIYASNDIDAIRTWLNEFRNSPNTIISYRQIAERFLMWCMNAGLKFNQLKREDIKDYELFLSDPSPQEYWCGKAKPRNHPEWKPFIRGLSPSSTALNMRVLTILFRYLIDSGYLLNNPFTLFKARSNRVIINKSIDRYLTHKEWGYIVEYIEGMPESTPKEAHEYERIKWVFALLYLTGCRRHEIASAKMSDFLNRHDNWWLRVIGKGNKYGEIPVTNELFLSLIRYRKFLRLPDFPSPQETTIPLVCSSRYAIGTKYMPISDSMLYKLIRNTCRRISEKVKETDPASAFVITQVSTHWLRHTSATHQVDAGIDIRMVKENLRHSMLETTMRYQHTEANTRHTETNKKFGINDK